MEGMGGRTANDKRAPSASTTEDRPQKSKRPVAAVSILPGGNRSYSKAMELITMASIEARWSGGEFGCGGGV